MLTASQRLCAPLPVPAVSGASGGLPRWVDFCAATLGICLLAPFLALIWLLVRLDSPGPAMFRQVRIGRGGRRFICYKVRTMRIDAPERPITLTDFRSFVFSAPSDRPDPRLTRIGPALRRTSTDELPQLFNVVRGEMALIGPRPELAEIVANYPPAYHRRHAVLPGISGLAQVCGRSNLAYEQVLARDLFYVGRRTAALDLAIVWRTLSAVARRDGAW